MDFAMHDNRPPKTATLEVEKTEEATDALRTGWLPALNPLGMPIRALPQAIATRQPPPGQMYEAILIARLTGVYPVVGAKA